MSGDCKRRIKASSVGGRAHISTLQVLDDADWEEAARAVVFAANMHSGQVCKATTRLIVQRGVSEKVIASIVELTKKLKAGDNYNDPTAQLSALFTEDHAESVVEIIEEAVAGGAKVLVGDVNRDHAIVQPHMLMDVTPGMRLWDREVFAPGTIKSATLVPRADN